MSILVFDIQKLLTTSFILYNNNCPRVYSIYATWLLLSHALVSEQHSSQLVADKTNLHSL